jgi:hypothetical protein
MNIKKRITQMIFLGYEVIFGTLTLNDLYIDIDELEVIVWLKENLSFFIANEDFGKTTERRHYHFVGIFNRTSERNWNYGYFDFRLVIIPNTTALSSYLIKIVKHHDKETTKKSKIISSKNWRYLDKQMEIDYDEIELGMVAHNPIIYKMVERNQEKRKKSERKHDKKGM